MTTRLFERHARAVQAGLARRSRAALAQHVRGAPVPHLTRAMQAALGGGKALRASLCLASARLFAPIGEAQWQAALAVEAIHAYSLAHDDLPAMDDAAERRGRPSLHVAFGEAAAILAGDALQSFAFALLADADLPAARRVQLMAGLAQAAGASGMAGGQSLDLAWNAAGHANCQPRDADALRQLHRLKTGALIVYAVEAGAVSAGAPARAQACLTRYAQACGLAYQLMDDVLDCSGDAASMGKPVRQNKGLGRASDQGRACANAALLMGEGAARAEAQALARRAQAELAPCPGAQEGKALLHAAAEFVWRRGA